MNNLILLSLGLYVASKVMEKNKTQEPQATQTPVNTPIPVSTPPTYAQPPQIESQSQAYQEAAKTFQEAQAAALRVSSQISEDFSKSAAAAELAKMNEKVVAVAATMTSLLAPVASTYASGAPVKAQTLYKWCNTYTYQKPPANLKCGGSSAL